MKKRTSIAAAVFSFALATALAAGSAQASVIYPSTAVGSSEFTGYEAPFAIDQGGISATTDWASNSQGVGSYLNLDLGAVYSLANAYVTDRVTSGGPNGAYFGGTSDFTTEFSLQTYTDSSFTTAIGSPLDFFHTAPTSPSGPADFLTVVALGGLTGEYLRYTVRATDGVNPGLSDINFSATPLPSTWLMLLIGFVGLGFFAYRGTKNNSPAFAAA